MVNLRSSVAVVVFAGYAIAAPHQAWKRKGDSVLLTDLDVISQYWGQLSPYRDNADDTFGVNDVGLPDGCQVEQVHTLQRHAQRFPTSYFDDGPNDERFSEKVENFTKANPDSKFTGPLTFLNTYEYHLTEDWLTALGAETEFASGVSFWNKYGRILYDAKPGEVHYESAKPKPVLRTTSQSRIENSQINWALGFFGPTYYEVPEPGLESFGNGSLFDVVIIPEGGSENNTLASYDSCPAPYATVAGIIGDYDMFDQYVPLYIKDATARVNQYAPEGFQFNVNDTYAMQSICAYENAYIGTSDFCGLFTEDEWAAFEQTLDIEYYYDYGFGNPSGRAQGLGYLQELLARLTDQYITSSNSSVNYTITNNGDDFPLGRPFYADFSHDDIIISTLTAMSLDYFHTPPDLNTYPPDPDRHFILSRLTPFGGKLITEVVGCADSNPTAQHDFRTYYYPTQYGYKASNAPHKFIRMRSNNGILPLETIRGGYCAGRADGLCAMEDFLASQYEAETLANYQFACFANYTLINPFNGADYDGTINSSTPGVIVYPGGVD